MLVLRPAEIEIKDDTIELSEEVYCELLHLSKDHGEKDGDTCSDGDSENQQDIN